MNYKPLAERVSYFKNDEGDKRDMCRVMDELLNEQKRDIVKDMISTGDISLEKISEYLKMPLEEVQKIAEKI